MSLPPLEPSTRKLERGDVHDDDAQVLEYLTQDDAEPPTPEDRPTVSPIAPVAEPRAVTRLLTGSIVLQNVWAPFQILTADPSRIHVAIRASSATATDTVRVSDDSGKIQAAGSAYLLSVGLGSLILEHSGPLYVSCPDAVGPVTVTWSAVTR